MATPAIAPEASTLPEATPAPPATSPEIGINSTPEDIANAARAAQAPEVEQPAPEAPETPAAPPIHEPFTVATLENGQIEVRLDSGERFVGSQDDLIRTMAKSKWDTNQYVNQLKNQQQPAPAPPVEAAQIDPAAQVLLDMLAPAFGLQTGQQLAERFSQQQETTEQYRGQIVAQQFYAANPDFPTSPANASKLQEYIDGNGLQYIPAHMRMAHLALKADGVYEQVNRAQPGNRVAARPAPNPAPPNSIAANAQTQGDPYAMPMDDLRAMIRAMGR